MLDFLAGIVGRKNVFANEPMKNHTSFRIGGNADFLVTPQTKESLLELVRNLKNGNIPYFVMGNGSNLLVSDNGIEGVVIKIARGFDSCILNGTSITAHSGILLSRLANFALDNSLTGVEFAAGIPGTLGGAVYMNAGAYGGEMKDVIKQTEYMDADGMVHTILENEHDFGYRESFFVEKGYIILSSVMELKSGERAEIKGKMEQLAKSRREKQPLDKPSGGSTFKRPVGHFAGTLIQDAGLKGFVIGGAAVSEKHAGFIVNTGGATCEDVKKLIEHVQCTVKEKFGVMLEPEIKMVGR